MRLKFINYMYIHTYNYKSFIFCNNILRIGWDVNNSNCPKRYLKRMETYSYSSVHTHEQYYISKYVCTVVCDRLTVSLICVASKALFSPSMSLNCSISSRMRLIACRRFDTSLMSFGSEDRSISNSFSRLRFSAWRLSWNQPINIITTTTTPNTTLDCNCNTPL